MACSFHPLGPGSEMSVVCLRAGFSNEHRARHFNMVRSPGQLFFHGRLVLLNEDVAKALEYFWARDKVVGAICHGAIALGNIADRIRGRRVTGFTLEGDKQLQALFGSGFLIPHYPQTVLEEKGAVYSSTEPYAPRVVIDGKLITGQNQQSASEHGLALLHKMNEKRAASSSRGR
jgi:putative intracellular protease/amidase